MADKIKQWPDSQMELSFTPTGDRGHVLALDGLVFANVMASLNSDENATIAKALCDRWNAYPKLMATIADLLRILNDMRADEDFDAMTCDAGGILFGDIASEAIEAAEELIA